MTPEHKKKLEDAGIQWAPGTTRKKIVDL